VFENIILWINMTGGFTPVAGFLDLVHWLIFLAEHNI
jgi:CRISPR/Cas system-associated protein Csm6